MIANLMVADTDWKRRDNPITRMRKWLELRSWWSADEETQLRTNLRKEVLQAFARAEKEKKPAIKNLFLDIFEKPSEDLNEQLQQLRRMIEEYPDEYDVESYEGGKNGL